jgi:hypothetical protein
MKHLPHFLATICLLLPHSAAAQARRPVTPPPVSFSLATSVSGTNQATGIASGDLTNNGVQDLIITDYSGGFFTALGNGDGTFQSFISQGGANVQLSIVVADINEDGILDFLLPDGIASYVYAFKGDGTGSTNAAEALYAGPLGSNAFAVKCRGRGRPETQWDRRHHIHQWRSLWSGQ